MKSVLSLLSWMEWLRKCRGLYLGVLRYKRWFKHRAWMRKTENTCRSIFDGVMATVSGQHKLNNNLYALALCTLNGWTSCNDPKQMMLFSFYTTWQHYTQMLHCVESVIWNNFGIIPWARSPSVEQTALEQQMTEEQRRKFSFLFVFFVFWIGKKLSSLSKEKESLALSKAVK